MVDGCGLACLLALDVLTADADGVIGRALTRLTLLGAALAESAGVAASWWVIPHPEMTATPATAIPATAATARFRFMTRPIRRFFSGQADRRHPAHLSAGINAMTLPGLCIDSASSAGVAAQFAASCRPVAAAIKALRQVPASNVTSVAIPPGAVARVIAFDVVVT